MTELLIHTQTQQQLDNLMSSPPHAILLAGPAGSGKRALATVLAETILGLPAQGLAVYPYKLILRTDTGKAIGIEAIRELEHFLSLKVPSQAPYNRTVIIEDAQLLTLEAQNALLKTLEEPPQGACLILTVNNSQALLPTVRSRTQSIVVQRPDQTTTEAYFTQKGFDAKAIRQAYAISGGLPGLMSALLDQTDDHPLLAATRTARQLLSQPTFERLLLVDELSKQRTLAIDTLYILQQMAHVSLQTASGQAAAKWQAVLTAAYEAAEAMAASAQPKLALTCLMLSF